MLLNLRQHIVWCRAYTCQQNYTPKRYKESSIVISVIITNNDTYIQLTVNHDYQTTLHYSEFVPNIWMTEQFFFCLCNNKKIKPLQYTTYKYVLKKRTTFLHFIGYLNQFYLSYLNSCLCVLRRDIQHTFTYIALLGWRFK